MQISEDLWVFGGAGASPEPGIVMYVGQQVSSSRSLLSIGLTS